MIPSHNQHSHSHSYTSTSCDAHPHSTHNHTRSNISSRLTTLAIATCLLTLPVECKVTLGLSEGSQWQEVSDFCFNFDSAGFSAFGNVHVRSFVIGDGHHLALMRKTTLASLGGDEGEMCLHIEQHAVDIIPLGPAAGVEAAGGMELDMTVGRQLDKVPLVSVLTRCGKQLSAEYEVTFTNPGPWHVKHFSYKDQGVILVTFVAWLFALLGSVRGGSLWVQLRHAHRENMMTEIAFLSGGACLFSITLLLVHVIVYASNGTGVNTLMLISSLCSFASNILFALILLLLANGVMIIQRGLDEVKQPRFTAVIGLLTLTEAFYWLYDSSHISVSPLSNLNAIAAIPYIFARMALVAELFTAVVVTMRRQLDGEVSLTSTSSSASPTGSPAASEGMFGRKVSSATSVRQRRYLLFKVGFGGAVWSLSPVWSVLGFPSLILTQGDLLMMLFADIFCRLLLVSTFSPGNFNHVIDLDKAGTELKTSSPSIDSLFIAPPLLGPKGLRQGRAADNESIAKAIGMRQLEEAT
eukprot:GHVN01003602.1.p1 GENE.GHVN01003602.1~~GHVN01003602.1.p1  ORF type:complete len:524 (-),score=77.06 GHVN01003602.1:1526-3097(-)